MTHSILRSYSVLSPLWGRMPGRPRGCLTGGTSTRFLRGSAVRLGLSACIACIPSWLGTSTACLGRAICLGESDDSLGLSACAACVHHLLGRVVSCMGNSAVCLGPSPQLRTSAVYLREVASTDCLRMSGNCLGVIVNHLGNGAVYLEMSPRLGISTVYL